MAPEVWGRKEVEERPTGCSQSGVQALTSWQPTARATADDTKRQDLAGRRQSAEPPAGSAYAPSAAPPGSPLRWFPPPTRCMTTTWPGKWT